MCACALFTITVIRQTGGGGRPGAALRAWRVWRGATPPAAVKEENARASERVQKTAAAVLLHSKRKRGERTSDGRTGGRETSTTSAVAALPALPPFLPPRVIVCVDGGVGNVEPAAAAGGDGDRIGSERNTLSFARLLTHSGDIVHDITQREPI